MQIGMVGLGRMGANMARRLMRDGHECVACQAVFTVAVNLSARQFESEELAGDIAAILQATGLPPQALELEVTESMAMEDVERSIHTLRALKDLGVWSWATASGKP